MTNIVKQDAPITASAGGFLQVFRHRSSEPIYCELFYENELGKAFAYQSSRIFAWLPIDTEDAGRVWLRPAWKMYVSRFAPGAGGPVLEYYVDTSNLCRRSTG